MSGYLLALRTEVEALAGAGHPPPCRIDPSPFTSDDREDRAEAAMACASACVLLELCGRVALASGQSWHVWGGVDVTRIASDPQSGPALLAARFGDAAGERGADEKPVGRGVGLSRDANEVAGPPQSSSRGARESGHPRESGDLRESGSLAQVWAPGAGLGDW